MACKGMLEFVKGSLSSMKKHSVPVVSPGLRKHLEKSALRPIKDHLPVTNQVPGHQFVLPEGHCVSTHPH